MKNLMLSILAIALPMAVSFACPSITGTFSCFDDETGETYDQTFNTSVVNGVTIYTVTDFEGTSEVFADNQWRDESSDGMTMKMKATCEDQTVVINSIGTFEGMSVEAEFRSFLNGNGDLESISKNILDGQPMPDYHQICYKK